MMDYLVWLGVMVVGGARAQLAQSTGYNHPYCGDAMFKCLKGICIDKSLTCNRVSNCDDSSDEDSAYAQCYGISNSVLLAAIVIGSLCGLLLICWLVGTLVRCVHHINKYWCACVRKKRYNDFHVTTVLANRNADPSTACIVRRIPPSYSSIFREATEGTICNQAAFSHSVTSQSLYSQHPLMPTAPSDDTLHAQVSVMRSDTLHAQATRTCGDTLQTQNAFMYRDAVRTCVVAGQGNVGTCTAVLSQNALHMQAVACNRNILQAQERPPQHVACGRMAVQCCGCSSVTRATSIRRATLHTETTFMTSQSPHPTEKTALRRATLHTQTTVLSKDTMQAHARAMSTCCQYQHYRQHQQHQQHQHSHSHQAIANSNTLQVRAPPNTLQMRNPPNTLQLRNSHNNLQLRAPPDVIPTHEVPALRATAVNAAPPCAHAQNDPCQWC